MSGAKAVREEVVSSETQFELLLPQIRAMVSWACHRYGHYTDPSVIDDLVEEIVFSLIKNDGHNLKSFEHRATERTWLRVVVLHHVAHYFKRQRPTESLEDLPVDSQPSQLPSQEDEVLFKELKELVEKADELTERDRGLLNHMCKGLDDGEIGEQMGIETRTVQRYKSVLRMKVRDIVKRLVK